MTPADIARIEPFITRWQNSGGNERANYQMGHKFLSEGDGSGFCAGDAYARNLSSKPPFLLTCDIGDHFEFMSPKPG
jgi:hypothetical protein